MFCWDCKHFYYDEVFFEETGEEQQIVLCEKGNDCDNLEDCKKCKDYEEYH